MKILEIKDGVIIDVFVKPNQPKFNVAFDDGEIVVFSTQEPVKGKVNKELIKELSRIFHAKVELVSGSASRHKQLMIKGVEKNQVEQLLHK